MIRKTAVGAASNMRHSVDSLWCGWVVAGLQYADNLQLLRVVALQGSLSAAARALGLVPSAMSYRIRQMEDALDVLLVDRKGKTKLTAAGQELVVEGGRLLLEMDAVANRIKRVASGWEPTLSIAIDSLISRGVVLDLIGRFYADCGAQGPYHESPTRIKIRSETLSGTWGALVAGQVDLAIGVAIDEASSAQLRSAVLGEVPFVFAVAPNHPLARLDGPISDAVIRQYRAIAVADSSRTKQSVTMGLLDGQEVLTVPDMNLKLDAHLRGLGSGFLPSALANPHIKAGRLILIKTQRRPRVARVSYAWRDTGDGASQARSTAQYGRALLWWLGQLEAPRTRAALLGKSRA